MMPRKRFNPVGDSSDSSDSPESQNQNPRYQIQSLADSLSRLFVSNPPPTSYVYNNSNVFPYGHVNPINNNNNNFVGVPLYPQESLWQNLYHRDEVIERQRREILRRELLESRRREVLERQRRERLATIQNLNHVRGRGRHWFDNFRGRVLELAKDHHYSRVLQEAMMTSGPEEILCIFLELIDHVTDLLLDTSGNYVVQRLVEICNEQQRIQIIQKATEYYFQFFRICKTPHGCRAFEKLLERVTTQEERSSIMSALIPGAIELSNDVNAHRVAVYCLKHFSKEDTKEFLYVVANRSSEVAKDKTGCCVMQEFIDNSRGEVRNRLIGSLLQNSLQLSEDIFGNYVAQYLVALKIPRITDIMIKKLERNFLNLACNKYGSCVIEKFFKESEEATNCILFELLTDPCAKKLLVDPYGNYVIGSALEIAKGEYLNAVFRLIETNSHMMRTNLYGKKLLDKFNKTRGVYKLAMH